MFGLLSMLKRCGICTATVTQGEFNRPQQQCVNNPHGSLGSNIEITYSRGKKKPICRPLKYKVRAFYQQLDVWKQVICSFLQASTASIPHQPQYGLITLTQSFFCLLYSEYSHRTFLTAWHTPESDCNGLSWVCSLLRFSNWQPHTVCATAQLCVWILLNNVLLTDLLWAS